MTKREKARRASNAGVVNPPATVAVYGLRPATARAWRRSHAALSLARRSSR